MNTEQKFHELKTWPAYFQRVKNGQKRFELRENDRNFQPGDYVKLCEFDPNPETGGYTGYALYFQVGYLLKDADVFGLKPGYCIFGLEDADYNDLMNFLSDHPGMETKLPLTYSLDELPF